jgi:hypothetical protein
MPYGHPHERLAGGCQGWDLVANTGTALMCCTVLYCTVLYCTVLYCTVLYCTVLYCTVLYCTVLHCTVLYCTALHCTALHCTALHCTALHCTALHCTVLYCTVLYCTVLYCTVLYCTVLYCTVLYCTVIALAVAHTMQCSHLSTARPPTLQVSAACNKRLTQPGKALTVLHFSRAQPKTTKWLHVTPKAVTCTYQLQTARRAEKSRAYTSQSVNSCVNRFRCGFQPSRALIQLLRLLQVKNGTAGRYSHPLDELKGRQMPHGGSLW